MATPIGQRLRMAREIAMLTQEELGERSGVQSVTISRIETGKQATPPRISTVRKLATVLGVDPAWIMHGIGEGPGEGKAAA